MKNPLLVFGVSGAILVAAAAYGAYTLGMDRGMRMAAPVAAASVPAAKAGRRVLYWHDPMVPGQKFDKPGKSPFMDMQLVPVYAEDDAAPAGAEGGVRIDPRIQQNLGVRTAEVTRGVFDSRLEAVGSVAWNERDVAVVQARSNGYVERLFVRAPLDPVRKGQPLAELYVPEWVAAQEEFLSVRRLDASAPAGLLDAARQRMLLAGMSREQVALVESDGKPHPRMTLAAPIGGVIGESSAREGMTVATGTPLFRINGLGTVWINAEVPESMAAQVRPGTPAEARASAFGDTVFKGTVTAILPEVNAATRTLKARVEVANPGGRLVPGMFARVTFAPSRGGEALLVPSEAVIRTGTRDLVMVAAEGGRFVPVEVELGAEAGGRTQVRRGVKEGDKVVVSGQFLLDSEASLKGLAVRALPGEAK